MACKEKSRLQVLWVLFTPRGRAFLQTTRRFIAVTQHFGLNQQALAIILFSKVVCKCFLSAERTKRCREIGRVLCAIGLTVHFLYSALLKNTNQLLNHQANPWPG